MASAVSKPVQVTTGTSVRNRKTNYYVSEVTTLGDGTLKRETFRSDAQGNNRVLVQTATTDKTGQVTNTTTGPNATTEEKRALSNPDSQLRNGIRTTTKDAGDIVQKNEADAAGGGLTEAGKRNQDIIGGGSGNKGDDDQTNDSEQGSEENLSTQSVPDADTVRNQFFDVVYPEDLRTTEQDVIRFTMLKYIPQDFSRENFGFSSSARGGTRDSLGTVTLNIPGQINDSNGVEWSGQKMNALEAAGASLALAGIQEGFTSMFDEAKNIARKVSNNSGELGTALANVYAGAAVGVGAQLLTRTTGAIINPNLELLFSGPTLRQFQFVFKLSARNSEEQKNIIKVIRFFKQGSAAQKSSSHLFLKSPHTFNIEYLHRGENHKHINVIKECACQNVSVNYTPEGNYSTFSDGAMASYELTLSFSELEPIYNNDYEAIDGNSDTHIGF